MTGPVDEAGVVAEALRRYDLPADATATLLTRSENATYRVDSASAGQAWAIRLHREDYHRRPAIESELAWIEALRADPELAVPAVLPTTDGQRVTELLIAEGSRHLVTFEWVRGVEPDENALHVDDFERLGVVTARLHAQARRWVRPPGFTRFSWDWDHLLGDSPRWGRWQDGIGIGPEELRSLEPAAALIRQRLEAYGTGPDRFGLIHADLRLANLLVDGDQVTVIDFDDCGFSWYLYDFGTAVSFIEDDPRLPDWQRAWLNGYRSIAEMSQADEAMLPTFVMLRRFALVAWMGSHSHSAEVPLKGADYARGTADLARRYVSSDGCSLF